MGLGRSTNLIFPINRRISHRDETELFPWARIFWLPIYLGPVRPWPLRMALCRSKFPAHKVLMTRLDYLK